MLRKLYMMRKHGQTKYFKYIRKTILFALLVFGEKYPVSVPPPGNGAQLRSNIEEPFGRLFSFFYKVCLIRGSSET
ncbi:hypothetical protein Y032_0032g2548 [Ancylostoma ceylanicum]|uniref:Uncharacterized protein n=1 Tax=Ancylostoma ceylanicum TaxID=53326 RepID=A0A016UPT7_9BILA|nr:hypothetical protein Y032_0032g2548 [Ancylostoma ceylanicum]